MRFPSYLISSWFRRWGLGAVGVGLGVFLTSAQVVINEIMYHAPEELDDQYVELHNAGREPVDLGGWSFSKGIQFQFPAGTVLAANGFVVVCRNAERFREFYSVPVVGEFSSKLKQSGERVELVNAAGQRVDSVKYSDRPPWPMGPDGHSGSLERISPRGPSDDPANWISSPLSDLREKPTGTPGQVNAGYSEQLPVVIQAVTFSPELPTPNQPIRVEASLPPDSAVEEVNVWYRLAGSGIEGAEILLPMKQSAPGRYAASIPGQKAEHLVRFRVEARGTNGTRRSFPASTEPRPALSAYVAPPITPAAIPFAWMIKTREAESKAAASQSREPMDDQFGGPPGRGRRGGFRGGPFGGQPPERTSFTAAFIYFDPASQKTQLFDFVQIHGRKGGQKVHFYRDQMLQEMTTVALIFEGDTAALVEPLAYEVYRRSGMPAARSHYVRIWLDGQPLGYTVLIEQPNKAFLRRHQINDDGTMYKLIWYGGDLVGQHEKHSHRQAGHDDLIQTVVGLEQTTGQAEWEFIQKNFAVDQVATYFAVNMLLSHWDGFFNNYFAYHDSEGTGKWMMFPWDQDSTWGLRGGRGMNVYYTMALTFGMNGDEPPERGRGGTWRPPGWFSGPLLANPQFRQVFLRRTRELLDTVYTEKELGPVIDQTEKLLTPEVRQRAQLLKWDPELAVQQLQYDLGRIREHLRLRRDFLLSQAELKEVAPTRSALPVPLESTNLHNLFRVTDRVYSGSQPEGEAAYQELARLGVRTVISVDGAKPDLEAARRLGLRYIHLPFGYDGIPSNRVVALAQTMASASGPIFVHCHHGKHRGPTAVAVMCLAAEKWTPEQATAWLKQAGTASDYRGLYQAVATFQTPSASALAAVGPLPEVAPPSRLVAAMVAVDDHLEHLKAVQKAGWMPPGNHPDLVPAQEALLLFEQLKELARHSDTQVRPAEYAQMLTQSGAAAERLHALLANSSTSDPEAREAALENLIKSCSTCHQAYRN